MNNILILGGSGFIGKNIIESFSVDELNKLVVVTRNQNLIEDSVFQKDNISVNIGSLEDFNFIESLIIDYKINIILHLVSGLIPSSKDSEFYEGIGNVVVPTFKLIDFISNRSIKLLFFSSGGTIYGNSDVVIKESSLTNPINNYGLSKLMIENYINYKKNNSPLDCIIIRPSNVYGKHQSFTGNQGFISVAINKICNGVPIEIWGDGNSIRDYIHVSDVVSIIKKLLDQSVSNVTLNLSTAIGKSLLEIIEIIEEHSGIKAIINFNNKRGVDANTVVLDNTELQALVSHDNMDIKEGIKAQIEYFNSIVDHAK